jgi:hypothetical protein
MTPSNRSLTTTLKTCCQGENQYYSRLLQATKPKIWLRKEKYCVRVIKGNCGNGVVESALNKDEVKGMILSGEKLFEDLKSSDKIHKLLENNKR